MFTAAFLLLFTVLVLGVSLGPSDVRVGPMDALHVVARHLGLSQIPVDSVTDSIVWDIRLPRALAGALVGALLACAGLALQGLLMNPLADPYTVGVAAGAGVGAALGDVLGIGAMIWGLGTVTTAFGGGLLAVAAVYWLARVRGRVAVETLLLAGVVVGSLVWSLIPLMMFLSHRSNDLPRLLYYLIGSIQGADWTRSGLLLAVLCVVLVMLGRAARDLDLMTVGEESAAYLGVETERVKRNILWVSTLATAAAVSVAGIIGFVGLVVPHIARRLIGPSHAPLVPLVAVLGACLVVLADISVRVWLDEMPIGVVTSLLGAPVFCLLLRQGSRELRQV